MNLGFTLDPDGKNRRGLLFLDELPEFPRNVIELLRQPLEESSITLARSNMTLFFPSRFVLVAAEPLPLQTQ